MDIVIVDDERIALQLLLSVVKEVQPKAKVYGFSVAGDALTFCSENSLDIAFLDIDMSDMDGISLAKHLKQINPKVNIIFVTAYQQYAIQAFKLYSSGYVMKPVTKEKVEHEIENLRHPIPMVKEHNIWAQCFGDFEFFVEGKPVKFKYSKTKELLAFLIDRKGALCSNGYITATLWEDEANNFNKSSYLRDLRADLINTLTEIGVEYIIIKKRGAMAIVTSKIACDYYNWLRGDIQGINAYRGEYMTQYSWSEFTHGGIDMHTVFKK
ncbi:MAG: response regulator [Erysipelotrichaceae bacterium]